ncbi:MAG: hypothetical protein ACI9F9_001593 [Candidatus Paceibacteria bacterium]|jgi:hypothetical protein
MLMGLVPFRVLEQEFRQSDMHLHPSVLEGELVANAERFQIQQFVPCRLKVSAPLGSPCSGPAGMCPDCPS